MVDSTAIIGMGITYSIDDGTDGDTFDLIGEVFEVTPPNQQTDEVEVTHYGSVGGFREFIAGLKDGGEASLGVNWLPGNASDVILRTLHGSGAVRTHKIVFPNGAEMSYSAWVKGFDRGTPMDDKLTATITARVTGASAFVDPA